MYKQRQATAIVIMNKHRRCQQWLNPLSRNVSVFSQFFISFSFVWQHIQNQFLAGFQYNFDPALELWPIEIVLARRTRKRKTLFLRQTKMAFNKKGKRKIA